MPVPAPVLLVTSPVDLGSKTLSSALEWTLRLSSDVEVHEFADEWRWPQGRETLARRYLSRLRATARLWSVLLKARSRGKRIIFQGTTALTFATPLLSRSDCYCITDWTRTLREVVTGAPTSTSIVERLQAVTFRRLRHIVALTPAVRDNLIGRYRVPAARISIEPPPVVMEQAFAQTPQAGGPVRLLFVGGDAVRKGGDVLVEWFESHPEVTAELTVITKTPIESGDPRVEILDGVVAGTEEHAALYARSHVFVLPTRWDAFPMALAEACASGLAIAATSNALGSGLLVEDGVNGIVDATHEALFVRLLKLAQSPSAVGEMMLASRSVSERLKPDVLARRWVEALSL